MAQLHIVVADDESGIRHLICDVLEEEGYAVRAFADGLSALAAIRTRPPALAILDVAMPVMTGDETLRQLRAEGCGVPIIMMTAATNPQRLLSEGASAVLGKPFDLEALLQTILRLLAQGRLRASALGEHGRGL
ncbi:MAG TPA: response regulator [Chloroflexaceae bacterium]|nr:response regulator [Chloroflexaceae bacterium]